MIDRRRQLSRPFWHCARRMAGAKRAVREALLHASERRRRERRARRNGVLFDSSYSVAGFTFDVRNPRPGVVKANEAIQPAATVNFRFSTSMPKKGRSFAVLRLAERA